MVAKEGAGKETQDFIAYLSSKEAKEVFKNTAGENKPSHTLFFSVYSSITSFN